MQDITIRAPWNTCGCKLEHLEIYQPRPGAQEFAHSSFKSSFSTALITFGRARLEESGFPGKTRTGLMRSNSQPVHKPRLPAGRPKHAGNSKTLKTKCSFPGCRRQELQRWNRGEHEIDKDRRHKGNSSECIYVCARTETQ